MMSPDSTPILRWYGLIEGVYQQLDALLATDDTQDAAPDWAPLLQAAANYFGLERLTLDSDSMPAGSAPDVLLFPLLPEPRLVLPAARDRSAIPNAAPVGCKAEHHLRAHLGSGSKPCTERRTQLQQFAKHVERCLQLQHRLQAERRALARLRHCLNQQPHAVVLCDDNGHATFINRAASELEGRVPELRLDGARTRYVASDGKEALGPLFERVRSDPQPVARLECSSGELHFTMITLPAQACADSRPPRRMLGLIIQEQAVAVEEGAHRLASAPAALRHRLRERCGLSEKEAQLAHALTLGLSIGGYAKLCGRSPQTLRKQVKSIFEKLGVHDQKHLILRLWQEQQAGWLDCVSLLAAGDELDTAAHTLHHPPLVLDSNMGPASALDSSPLENPPYSMTASTHRGPSRDC